MNVIFMYRDGAVAQVDTDYVETHERFLAAGWVPEEPVTEAEPALVVDTPVTLPALSPLLEDSAST